MTADHASEVACPNLLGAILMKARALGKPNRPQDRDDLLALLSCVAEPLRLAEELKPSERTWLVEVALP